MTGQKGEKKKEVSTRSDATKTAVVQSADTTDTSTITETPEEASVSLDSYECRDGLCATVNQEGGVYVPNQKTIVNLPGPGREQFERDQMPQLDEEKGYSAQDYARYLQDKYTVVENENGYLDRQQLLGGITFLQKQVNFNRKAYDKLNDPRNQLKNEEYGKIKFDYLDGKPIKDAMVIVRRADTTEEIIINGATRLTSMILYAENHPGVTGIYVGGPIVYIDAGEESVYDAARSIAIPLWEKWMRSIGKDPVKARKKMKPNLDGTTTAVNI